MNKTSFNYLSKTSSLITMTPLLPLEPKPATPVSDLRAPLPPKPLPSLPLGLECNEPLSKYDLYPLTASDSALFEQSQTTPGPQGMTLAYKQPYYQWVPCHVLQRKHHQYLISVQDKQKWVHRLNLVYSFEDQQQFVDRLTLAKNLMLTAQDELRYQTYLHSRPIDPIHDQWWNSIKSKIKHDIQTFKHEVSQGY